MKRWFITTFLVFGLLRSVSAKIYIDITNPSSAKIGVVLRFSGYPLVELRRVLESDLMVYGIFALYPVDKYSFSEDELRLIGADLLLEVDASVLKEKLRIAYLVKDLTEDQPLFSDTIEGFLDSQIEYAHKIADSLYRVVTGNKGMFYRKAVAFRKVIGGYELVLVDVGALRYKRLAFFKEPAQSPSLSPDGRYVAFSKLNGKDFDLYLFDIKAGKYSLLCSTPCPDTAAVWMPDGKRILFAGCVKGGNIDVLVCDVGKRKVVGRLTRSIAIDTSPSVSPEGDAIAFVSNREGRPHVYVKNLKTGVIFRISDGRYDVSPDWSPKGDKIVFSSITDMGPMIGVYNVASGKLQYLYVGEEPTWSPNGDYILYLRGSGLYISPIYGSGETRLFVGKWINPSWR